MSLLPGGLHRIIPGLFLVSSAFPVVASSLAPDSRPYWLGVADVALAAVVTAGAIAISMRYHDRVVDRDRLAAQDVSQRVLALIPVLLLLFFLTGERLDWTVLVVGLAWRAWLLLHVMPTLIAVRRDARSAQSRTT